ncbi:MAG TPA: MoaD/ThiS family protein [Arachnia sp.]|nr:MoaD/ThiS family protein [Arachnia sp.]
MATVRYFAAAAEAAGTEQEQVAAPTLGALLADLRSRHGARLSRVLEVSSVLHDGRYVEDPSTPLADDALLDVLPPFAGG